jgi:hypothetical protein
MGDVAILDVACNRVNEDGSVGERIMSGEQKGSFLPNSKERIRIPNSEL